MLATPIIIGIAVGAGLVALFAIGAGIHIHLQRKRTRRYLNTLSQDLAAYHRTRLSAYENNYAHVGQPTANPRSSLAQPNIAGWSALESQERINQEVQPAQLPDDSPLPPRAKRKKSLRDSLYGHSGANVPKTRRQKKIAKAISLKDMNRSPLSAITEMTDSTELPPVEMPTERTPRVTPERDGFASPVQSSTNWSLPISKKRSAPMSPVEIDTPVSLKHEPSINTQGEIPRSASNQSDISEAPEGPLPPLPTFELYKPNGVGRRLSQMSTDTVGSSVLGPAMSSPSEAQLPFKENSGMQDFDFGFTNRSTPRVGPSPGRLTGWCSGASGVASVVPSFDYQARQWSTVSVNQPSTIREVQPEDGDKWTPTAEFFFGAPRQVSNRHSMLDYSSSTRTQRTAIEQRKAVGNVSPASLPPRPASVASSNPYRSDSRPLFAGSRLSSGSTGSGRRTPGHRRQNCVRISIPVPTRHRRPSLISEILEDSDDEADSSPNKVQIVDITRVSSVDRVRAQSRRSIVDENGSPTMSPLANRPVLNPTRPRRTASYASRNSPVSRPHSDTFHSNLDLAVTESKPKTPDPFANPDRWALAPTPPSAVTLNPPLHEDSPTLPSPISPLKASSNALTALPPMEPSPTRKSRLMGPRSPPSVISTNVHLQTGSSAPKTLSSPRVSRNIDTARPIPGPQQTSVTSPSDADLRQSVTMLRSMGASGRHLNSNSGLYPTTASFLSSTSSRNNHDDWKELNAIWEVSSSNSIESPSPRAITRDNSLARAWNPGKRGHRQSISQGNPPSSETSPALGSGNGISRNNSIATMSRAGYGMRQGSVSAGGGYLPTDSNVFGLAHSRQPSMFGSSKRKMSTSVSHSHNTSQASAARDWNMNTAATGNSSANRTANLRQSSNWGQYGNMSRSGSPGRMSIMSVSGMSIWEDDSIRGDSPEPPTRQHSVTASSYYNSPSPNNNSNNNGPGPALSTTFQPSRQQQQEQQPQGLDTSPASRTKPKPIIFDDAYSQSHLVSPLNDSDMENLTPTAQRTFGSSRYAFNFPAVPSNNNGAKRVSSRGNTAPIQGSNIAHSADATQKRTATTDLQQSQFSSATGSTTASSSFSTFGSPSLQPQPLRSHLTHAPQQQQQQQQNQRQDSTLHLNKAATPSHNTPSKSQMQSQNQGHGLGLRVGDKLLGTPGSLRSLYDGDGFLKESPLRVGYGNYHNNTAGGGAGNTGLGLGLGVGVVGGGPVVGSSMRTQMIRGEGVGWQRR